jgi:hypothetical protein
MCSSLNNVPFVKSGVIRVVSDVFDVCMDIRKGHVVLPKGCASDSSLWNHCVIQGLGSTDQELPVQRLRIQTKGLYRIEDTALEKNIEKKLFLTVVNLILKKFICGL